MPRWIALIVLLAATLASAQQPPAPVKPPVAAPTQASPAQIEAQQRIQAANQQLALQQVSAPAPPDGQGVQLQVQAVDAASGDRLPGVSVELKRNPVVNSQQTTFDRRRWSYAAHTDPQGNATINNVVADRYSIDVTLKGYVLTAGTARTITLAAGKSLPLSVRMWRGSAVEGVVEDRDGNPLAMASVEILEEGWTGGLRTLALSQAAATTDNDGKYSFTAVLPGTYYLRATPQQGLVQQQLRDSDKDPAAEKKHVAYVGTLYPSSLYLEGAAPVTLFAGVDQHGLRIEVQKSKYYSFSGHVEGVPLDQRTPGLVLMRLVSFDSPFPFIAASPYAGALNVQLKPDGTFTAPSVPPGPYWAGFTPAGAVRGGAQFLILDRDITDFRAEVTPGLTFSGKAVYEDGKPVEPMGVTMGVFQTSMGVYVRDFGIGAMGEFTSPGLPEGTYRMEIPSGSAVVRKIEIDGRTFPGGEFELRRGSGAATITLSRAGSTIGGTVDLAERAKAYPRGLITITPVPLHPTDNPKRKRLDGNPAFAVDHMESGRYRVCAWLEEGAEINRVLGNPRYEQRLASSCETVDLDKDDNKQVQLKQMSATDFK